MNFSDWYKSNSTIKPLEVDTTSSKKVVFIRKDITTEPIIDDEGNDTGEVTYHYLERKIRKEDWESYKNYHQIEENEKEILALKEENAMLTETVDMLTACILEMSELVYA